MCIRDRGYQATKRFGERPGLKNGRRDRPVHTVRPGPAFGSFGHEGRCHVALVLRLSLITRLTRPSSCTVYIDLARWGRVQRSR